MTFASMAMMKGIWLSIAFILVSDYPVVVDDKDVYPVEVVERNLNLVYYGEQLIDVLIVALDEKSDASTHDLVDALNYYNRNDTFMPFA